MVMSPLPPGQGRKTLIGLGAAGCVGALCVCLAVGVLLAQFRGSGEPANLMPTSTSRLAPTATRPAPTEAPDLDARLDAIKDDIFAAYDLNEAEQWAEALPQWDAILAQVPDFAEGYYQRTRCYLHLNADQRVLTEYRATLDLAYADMNEALWLDPLRGDYYFERSVVENNYAEIEVWRADADAWRELALADVQAAIANDTTRTFIERDVAFRLLDLWRFDEALTIVQALTPAEGMTWETDPGIQEGLAEVYLGLDEPDEALKHVDLAMAANPGIYKEFERSLILYRLDRLDEAAAQLDASISARPGTLGARHYLRALIYYRLGDPDMAEQMLEAGSRVWWERGGLRSYVLGLLARDAGQKRQATALLAEAEASLHPRYSPFMLAEIQADLAALSGTRP